MTRRTQWEGIAAGLLSLGLAAVLIPLLSGLLIGLPLALNPPREAERLTYPGRVTFTQTAGGYTRVAWDAADWDHPDPCPLAVRLAGTNLAPADLGSPDRLRRLGW